MVTWHLEPALTLVFAQLVNTFDPPVVTTAQLVNTNYPPLRDCVSTWQWYRMSWNFVTTVMLHVIGSLALTAHTSIGAASLSCFCTKSEDCIGSIPLSKQPSRVTASFFHLMASLQTVWSQGVRGNVLGLLPEWTCYTQCIAIISIWHPSGSRRYRGIEGFVLPSVTAKMIYPDVFDQERAFQWWNRVETLLKEELGERVPISYVYIVVYSYTADNNCHDLDSA